jgi:hypothetical protein
MRWAPIPIALILALIAIFALQHRAATAPHQGQPRRVATATVAFATQTVSAGQTADAHVMATLTAVAQATSQVKTGGPPVYPAQAMATGTADAQHVAAFNAYCNYIAAPTPPAPSAAVMSQFSPYDCTPPSN